MTAILGADGRIHSGDVVFKFSATLMEADCGAEELLRPIRSDAELAAYNPERRCPACWEDE